MAGPQVGSGNYMGQWRPSTPGGGPMGPQLNPPGRGGDIPNGTIPQARAYANQDNDPTSAPAAPAVPTPGNAAASSPLQGNAALAAAALAAQQAKPSNQ